MSGMLITILVAVVVGLWIWERRIMVLERDFKASVAEFRELSNPKPKAQTEDRFSPLRKDEMLTAFAVADDDPLLEAVVHVLHALEIERGDNASESSIPPDAAKGYAMSAGALKDAQEEILRWVDEANRAKKGKSGTAE